MTTTLCHLYIYTQSKAIGTLQSSILSFNLQTNNGCLLLISRRRSCCAVDNNGTHWWRTPVGVLRAVFPLTHKKSREHRITGQAKPSDAIPLHQPSVRPYRMITLAQYTLSQWTKSQYNEMRFTYCFVNQICPCVGKGIKPIRHPSSDTHHVAHPYCIKVTSRLDPHSRFRWEWTSWIPSGHHYPGSWLTISN